MRPERWRWLIAGAFVALAGAALVAPGLLGLGVPMYRDLGAAVHPVLSNARQVSDGSRDPLPLWSNDLSNGRPLLGNPGNALLAPLNVLYLVLPFDIAFSWFIGLHVILTGLFMFLLARKLGASAEAAAVAGLAWCLGGQVVSALNLYPTLAALAWAPLVVFAALHAVMRPSTRNVALLAAALAAEALGGQPEPVLLTLVVGGVVTLAALTEGSLVRRMYRVAWVWGLAGIWALALSAPQILPAALHARESLRSYGFTAAGLLYNSVHPMRLPGLVLRSDWWGGNPLDRLSGGYAAGQYTDTGTPYFLSLYVGVAAAALALAGLLFRRDRIHAALAACAGVGILLSLGHHFPGFTALAHAHPGIVPFRYPEKIMFLAFFAVPLLAARGVDAIAARTVSERTTRALGALMALLVGVDLGTAHARSMLWIPASELHSPPLVAKLEALSRERGAPERQWRVYHQRPAWPAPRGSGLADEEAVLLWRRGILAPMTACQFGIVAAVEPTDDLMDDKRYFALARKLHRQPWPERAVTLGKAGVLWIVSPDEALEAASDGVLARVLEVGPEFGVAPRSAWVYQCSAWRPRTTVSPEPGTAAIIDETHRSLAVKVSIAQDGELVVTDVLAKGWRAELDGVPVPFVSGHEPFRCVAVPAGEHVVRFAYLPPGLSQGALLAAMALAGLAVALVRRG